MHATGSKDLKIWLPDGTNYPGQADIRARQDRLADSLRPDLRPPRARPAAGAGVQDLRAVLLHDGRARLGHVVRRTASRSASAPSSASTPATTRPTRTSSSSSRSCCASGRLGAFDFNSRFYADDDLMVGAADPFQLFRIMWEVRRGGGLDPVTGVTFMLDQCHNIEAKIPGQIRSVMNVQEATAKALLVDTEALTKAQDAGDVLGANEIFMDAYHTDVRPMLRDLREAMGLAPDPVRAYAASGYAERICAERVGGAQAGWGA